MKVVVFGAGATGARVARQLVASDLVTAVEVRDPDDAAATRLVSAVGSQGTVGRGRRLSPDTDAVVDPETMAVHGVENLHVADASVMPQVTSANTNAPTLMIGEKGAAHILAAAGA